MRRIDVELLSAFRADGSELAIINAIGEWEFD